MCTLIYLFLAARFSGDHADEQQGLVTELKLAMVVYDKISSMIFISFSFFFPDRHGKSWIMHKNIFLLMRLFQNGRLVFSFFLH
jgi:hypothetical protein